MANKSIVLNALIFLSAITSIGLDYKGSSLYYLFKPLTTILVILLPLLTSFINQTLKKTLLGALCFCLLGDVLLLNPNYFVFGLVAFLIAHLLFAKLFISLKGFQKNGTTAIFLLGIVVGLYLWLYPDLGALKYPVAAYVMVILVMAWQGISVYLKERRRIYGLLALGAMFFMFSDSIIAVDKFRFPFKLSGAVILSTYWLAITLIANSFILDLEATKSS